jgi:CheY-like chemotaxis protein
MAVTSVGEYSAMLTPTVLLRRPTILVVDDEESLRLYLARLLEDEGYRVITARDGNAALALIEHDGSVRLVITDVSMPNLSGPELVRRMAARPPVPPVLFISGSPQGSDLPGPLLPKPFLSEEMTRLVRCLVPEEPPRRESAGAVSVTGGAAAAPIPESEWGPGC